MGALAPHFVALDWNGTTVPFFGLPPYPGALAAVAAWRARGLPVYVVSRASQRVIAADVARAGLACEGVIGCADKAPVLSDLRAQHGNGVYLGDTEADREAAAAAGVDFLHACLEGQEPFPGAAGSFRDWAGAARLLAAPPEKA